MRIHSAIVTVILMFITIVSAYGQFTISNVDASGVDSRVTDSIPIKIPLNYSNDFFNLARWKAEKRVLRKERNTLEFNSALQAAQTQFENWAPGGDNTFSGRSTLFFRYQYKNGRFYLENKFEARYGFNYIDKKSFKNEDEWKFYYLTGWNFHRNWGYSASVNMRSQFATGYESRTDRTRKSTFMAPGYLEIAVGATYNKEPWSIVFSPVGGNATFVLDDELSAKGIAGLDPGQRTRWQVGPSVRVNFDKAFVKEIFRLRSDFYTFTNIKTRPTVRWENTLDIRATKFFTTTVYCLAQYDHEVKESIQVKYSFSIGLAYTFNNK